MKNVMIKKIIKDKINNNKDIPFVFIDYEGTYYLKKATEQVNKYNQAEAYMSLYR